MMKLDVIMFEFMLTNFAVTNRVAVTLGANNRQFYSAAGVQFLSSLPSLHSTIPLQT